MKTEKQIFEDVKSLILPYMNEELADLKTNEIMRITGHSLAFANRCSFCGELLDENGDCPNIL